MSINVQFLLLVMIVMVVIKKCSNKLVTDLTITIQPRPDFKTVTLEDYLKRNGLELQIFEILTEDDYYLRLYRYYDKNKGPFTHKTPILLLHGLYIDCGGWFIVEFEHSLVYLLLQNHYDVWCLNFRGTIPSRKHKHVSVHSRQFWNISIEDTALYDMPPTIDFIRKYTEKDKIEIIGYSVGTTVMFILCSEIPEYNQKVGRFLALGPSAVAKPKFLVYVITSKFVTMLKILSHFVYYVYLPREHILRVCKFNSVTNFLCTNMISMIVGFNPEQNDYASTRVFLSVGLVSIPMKQFLHVMSLYNSQQLVSYDYGKSANLKLYGSTKPKVYNLTNVSTKVFLMYGNGDWIATPSNSKYLHKRLPNSEVIENPCRYFNHLDFIKGKYVKECLYDEIILILNKKYP